MIAGSLRGRLANGQSFAVDSEVPAGSDRRKASVGMVRLTYATCRVTGNGGVEEPRSTGSPAVDLTQLQEEVGMVGSMYSQAYVNPGGATCPV